MAWIGEYGSGTTGTSTIQTEITSNVSVGHTLWVAVVNLIPSTTATGEFSDDAGNTYVQDAIGTVDTNCTVTLAHTVVTNPITAGEKVTFVCDYGFTTRQAMSIQHFDDTVTGIDSTDVFTQPTGLAALNAGTASTDDSSALFICAWGLVNAPRVFTPGSGWTGGTKVVSTGGIGDRAVVMQWKYGSGSTDTLASLNTGGVWVGVSAAGGLDAQLPPQTGGTFIVIDGEEVPVSLSIVKNGIEVPATAEV